MKKTSIFLLLFLGFILLQGFSIVKFTRVKTAKKITYNKALEMLKDTYPDGYFILQQDDKKSVEFWLDALSGFIDDGGISAINTAVHETLHHYDFLIADFDHEGYFITKGIELFLEKDGVFKSSEIVSLVPKEIKEGRFEEYVSIKGNENMSSIIEGIYGLLEEFSAYYHGNQASVNLILNGYGKSDVGSISDEMESYYEFNIFMACYLIYAKHHYPKKYKETIENKNLVVCYTLIEKRFATLIETVKKEDVLNNRFSLDYEVYYTQEFKDALSVIYKKEINEKNFEKFLF